MSEGLRPFPPRIDSKFQHPIMDKRRDRGLLKEPIWPVNCNEDVWARTFRSHSIYVPSNRLANCIVQWELLEAAALGTPDSERLIFPVNVFQPKTDSFAV